MAGRRTPQLTGEPADVAFFEGLMAGHLPRLFASVMRRLPSDPRCRLCKAPFGGPGGRVMRRFGFGPSRKNPTLCNTCFEKAPMGGVEMEIGVLFADVRGFTALSERMAPDDVAQLLNRFYAVASKVLIRSRSSTSSWATRSWRCTSPCCSTIAGRTTSCATRTSCWRRWASRRARSPGCRSGSASTWAGRTWATSARATSRTSPRSATW